MRTALAFVLWSGGLAACAGNPGPGQQSALPPPPPLAQGVEPEPASLLRRVAEAADGYRDGTDKYVLADRKFPHHVLGVFDSLAQARDSLSRSKPRDGSEYKVYGPFRTPPDAGYVERAGEEIVEVIVVRADKTRKSYDGRKYDAMFWGMTAFDKFVAPYLTSVSGVAEAAYQRRLYLEGKSPLVHSTEATHKRDSF
jgi:hypothetical protein